MNDRTRYLWIFVLTIFTFGVGLLGGVAFDRVVLAQVLPSPIADTGSSPNFKILDQAYQLIQSNYVDRSALKPDQLQYGAVSGMVDALGDTGHSRFLTPQMVTEQNNFQQGELEGIGAEVQSKDNQTVIVAPIDGSPAQKAGLAPGDIILKVNGEDVTGLDLTQVVTKILGPAGTKVTITIQRPSTGKIEDITLTRARIVLQNVTWATIPGTQYADLRLAAFSNNVTDDLIKALQQIQKQGMKGIVLDLRNNPGGLLDEAVKTTSQFIPSGTALEVKDAKGNISKIPIRSGGIATQIPMVVLVNQGTGSASEIVSGAIQDYNRAKLVGDTTFGTGTVLNQFALSDGSAILLATEEWLTPNGRVIWHQGIKPDIVVPLPATATLVVSDSLKSMTPSDLKNSSDAQLQKAIQVLSGAG